MLVRRNFLVIFRNILLSCVLFNIFVSGSYETFSFQVGAETGQGRLPQTRASSNSFGVFELVRSDGSGASCWRRRGFSRLGVCTFACPFIPLLVRRGYNDMQYGRLF